MVRITEVVIFSVDKSEEDSWSIEGELLFEEDLTTPFSAEYFVSDDEFSDFELEIDPGGYDLRQLHSMVLKAAKEFED